jgi:ribosome maturation factor RimP
MQLAELIENTLKGMGFELVELETSPRARLLRIFIDRPEGSEARISIDDCAAVSSQLSRIFVVENIDYDRLEVSSPGMDRPLIRPSDFKRFAGSEVQIKLRIAMGNQRNFSGVLLGFDEMDGKSIVKVQSATETYEFAFENIDRARLVPKF